MIGSSYQRFRHRWRLNSAVLLCLTLASALLAVSSGYGRQVATEELQQSLDETSPAGRTLLVTGSRYSFTDDMGQRLREILGEALKDHLVIRHAMSWPDQQPVINVAGQDAAVTTLNLYSFNLLAENVRVVEGRLPGQVRLYEATDSWRPPPIEAVIGRQAAEQSGYRIGDRVSGMKGYHRLNIVGIVEALDPSDDLWGQDLSAFEIAPGENGNGPENFGLPLIIASTSMQSNYPERPVFVHEVSWRITINRHSIDVDKVNALRSDLINFQTQSATKRASLQTDLVDILEDLQTRVSRLRTMVYLLSAQALVLVLYALSSFATSLIARTRVELATLAGRGASVWQVLQVYITEKLLMALVAALFLGPGLAQVSLYLWNMSSGDHSLAGLGREAWLLSGLAAGLGWLSLVSPAYSTVRKGSTELQSWRRRPSQRSLIQRRYIDVFLLVFGGLLTWQLNRSGSFLMQSIGESRLADPLLLTGPTLMVIAAAMTSLRALPTIFRLADRLSQPLRNVVIALCFSRLARDPLPLGRLVLLVGLTAGLVLFSSIFADTSTSANEKLQLFQHDVLAQGITNALRLNATALTVFSLTVFALGHLFSALDRREEYSVLRATGFSIRQSVALLVVEGSLVLALGLATGVAVGLGLSRIMIPFFLEMLIDQFGEPILTQLAVDWSSVLRPYLLLVAIYVSALALLAGALLHTRAHWTMSIGDE
jgi:hypothetical protein